MTILMKNALAIIIVAFALSLNLFAQTKYSLNDCISQAIRNNYDLLQTANQKVYDSVMQKAAFYSYFPNVNASASYSHLLGGQSTETMQNSYSFGVNSNLNIYDGGSREYNYKIADNNAKLTDAQTKLLAEQIKLSVYQQFVEVIRLQEISKARNEDIEASKSQYDNLKNRYDVGVIPIDMLLSQEAELGSKEIQLLYADIDVNTAKQNLLTLMGSDPSIAVDFDNASIPAHIDNSDITNFRNNIGTLQNSIQYALAHRYDYSVANVSKEYAELNKKSASSSYLPSLSANFNYGFNGYDFDNFGDRLGGSVGLNLSVPIFSNYSTTLQVQQAELNTQQQNTEILKLEQKIKAEVQSAYFNLGANEKALQIAEKSLVAAKQNYLSAQEKLNVGASNLTDYIVANSQYINAQINQISAVYLYLSARQNILFVTGRYQ